MNNVKKAAMILIGIFLIASFTSFAAIHVTFIELTTDKSTVSGQDYGVYGYATYYNTSDSGRGSITCYFRVLVGGTWAGAGYQVIAPDRNCELGGHGDANGSDVYNYQAEMTTVWNYDNGFYMRTGEAYLKATRPSY